MGSMVEIRPIRPDDSVEELTKLLHGAYAHLGSMGLNYTAVDQSVDTTLERIKAGWCLVAAEGDRLVGTIVVEPTGYDISECPYLAGTGVASAHQLAVSPPRWPPIPSATTSRGGRRMPPPRQRRPGRPGRPRVRP